MNDDISIITPKEKVKMSPLKIADIERILDFQKILDKIAQADDGKVHVKIRGKLSTTELCGCIRSSWYSRMFPLPYEVEMFRAFLFGNMVHAMFQKSLNYPDRYKLFKETELLDRVSYTDEERAFHFLLPFEKTGGRRVIISGRLDSIIYLRGADKPIIVDYKTTRAIKYNLEEAKDAHIQQLNFYLGCTLADHGILVYIDKGTFQVVQHTIDYSHERFQKMIDFAVALDNALETKTCPKIDKAEMKTEGYCSYCKYCDKCKLEEGKSYMNL